MWAEFVNVYSPNAEIRRDEINTFEINLNKDIQRLDLSKEEVIEMLNNIYKGDN